MTTTHWFKEKYRNTLPQLQKDFGFSSVMQLPKIEKVVLNMGAGREVSNSKAIEEVEKELALIAGQKPIKVKAKNSLASWKLREGMPMGAKVTLRDERMWSFLAKLISVVLPRVRDFRGLNPNSFDQQGNYALGIKEQIVFPEISFENVRKVRGLDIIIVLKSPSIEASRALLRAIGFPFAPVKGDEKK